MVDSMFPNVDPKKLQGMLDKLGIKSTEIESVQVIIRCNDRDIIVDEPQVTLVEGQGMRSFQISGNVREVDRSKPEISDDDVAFVQEQTGVRDAELVRRTLEETGGDNAAAILRLKKQQ